MDIIWLAAAVAFFALTVASSKFLERLRAED